MSVPDPSVKGPVDGGSVSPGSIQPATGHEDSLILSYLALRKAIGLLGMALPLVVSVGAGILFQTGIRSSISGYYYTGMRDVFVGTLCAIGVFLFSYRGYERSDDIAGDLACVFAIGVALFPTARDDPAAADAGLIGQLHLVFAALFFLTLMYFSLFLFTKTDPTKRPTRRKLQRNKVYKACGYTMGLCLLLIVVYSLVPTDAATVLRDLHSLFWLEAVAIVAFGISWGTKGEAILKDEV